MRGVHLWNGLGVFLLVAMSLPFALYAIDRGLAFASASEQANSRVFHAGNWISNLAIYGHMVTGGIITVFAPLQLLAVVRVRIPQVHRLIGYLVVCCALATSLGGLTYIICQGTIGGPVMSAGFGLYGALMLLSALRTVTLARVRDPEHRLWAERLIILALASWLYRVHYGLWEIATGGIGVREDFSGLFDKIQVFAFFLPYLVLHQIHWRWRKRGQLALA